MEKYRKGIFVLCRSILALNTAVTLVIRHQFHQMHIVRTDVKVAFLLCML